MAKYVGREKIINNPNGFWRLLNYADVYNVLLPQDLRNYIDSGEHLKLEYNFRGAKYDISFDVCDLPFCCGVLEFGNLIISRNFPQKAFNHLIETICRSTKRTFIINTNGLDNSKMFEEKLKKCGWFTAVKSFKNPSSHNRVIIWISNN